MSRFADFELILKKLKIMKVTTFLSLLGLVLFTSCNPFGTSKEVRSWEYVVSRIDEMNSEFQYADIPAERFTEEDKKNLMSVSDDTFEDLLQQMYLKLTATNDRSKEFSDAQREMAEAFLNIVDPLLAASKSEEEYHRIVLEYRQYCQPSMVERSIEWIKLNVRREDWGDLE